MVDLKFETVETGKDPSAAVIWLHGLGADGFNFSSIVPQLNLPKDLSVRFVFPHAPTMPVTMNSGYIMPAWYDLYSLKVDNPDTNPQDAEGIKKSAQHIKQLIVQENARGIPNERIILVGFSQGGAMTLYTGLTMDKPLAGLIALSCYLPLHTTIENELNPASKTTPIMMAHGRQDPVVLFEYGKESTKLLEELGYQVDWFEYPMEHSVCPDETLAIGKWITSRLNN